MRVWQYTSATPVLSCSHLGHRTVPRPSRQSGYITSRRYYTGSLYNISPVVIDFLFYGVDGRTRRCHFDSRISHRHPSWTLLDVSSCADVTPLPPPLDDGKSPMAKARRQLLALHDGRENPFPKHVVPRNFVDALRARTHVPASYAAAAAAAIIRAGLGGQFTLERATCYVSYNFTPHNP